ncbi:hypothetical protein THRCLA_09091 [Thraustotheca clavata]|uniref:Uncharacterized protein n=1 Tax=Thraustotheca clavata TaxID=74557 RepID=A0A1V9YZQ0_9STRA|nr:hypothetical protein THRCLA_09091 [Thraustotheca clavata]
MTSPQATNNDSVHESRVNSVHGVFQIEEPYCYMCLDNCCDGKDMPMELIAPCPCESYVHRKCLDHWRVTSYTVNAMTHCPTCKTAYVLKEFGAEEDYKRLLRKEQLKRLFLVVLVVFIGSGVIWLIDRGTPKFFQLHWNGMDGKLYDWVGLETCPRFLVYFVMSLLMTAFIIGVITIVCLCIEACRQPGTCVCYGDCSGLCDCGSCGGEAAPVVLIIVVALFIFVGLYMLFVAIVGTIGSAANRIGERRVRTVQTTFQHVENLRPLPQQLA